MPYRANYPATVAEVLDASFTFKAAALAAVRALARAKPWQGSQAERVAKIHDCNVALASAYGIAAPRLLIAVGSRADCYLPASHTICLGPGLSVVTFLHEFGHAAASTNDRRAAGRSTFSTVASRVATPAADTFGTRSASPADFAFTRKDSLSCAASLVSSPAPMAGPP